MDEYFSRRLSTSILDNVRMSPQQTRKQKEYEKKEKRKKERRRERGRDVEKHDKLYVYINIER
jgi:hypothetical protein